MLASLRIKVVKTKAKQPRVQSVNYLLEARTPFQMVQFHDVVTVQDESVGVLRADETGIQLLHTPGREIHHGSW